MLVIVGGLRAHTLWMTHAALCENTRCETRDDGNDTNKEIGGQVAKSQGRNRTHTRRACPSLDFSPVCVSNIRRRGLEKFTQRGSRLV